MDTSADLSVLACGLRSAAWLPRCRLTIHPRLLERELEGAGVHQSSVGAAGRSLRLRPGLEGADGGAGKLAVDRDQAQGFLVELANRNGHALLPFFRRVARFIRATITAPSDTSRGRVNPTKGVEAEPVVAALGKDHPFGRVDSANCGRP